MSNLPPSSAFTAEGKRSDRIHPHSHKHESIFSLQLLRNQKKNEKHSPSFWFYLVSLLKNVPIFNFPVFFHSSFRYNNHNPNAELQLSKNTALALVHSSHELLSLLLSARKIGLM